MMQPIREVERVLPATTVTEGDGVTVHRSFPTRNLMDLDPFLLFDHMGPMDLGPGDARGFPDHPHRGFETVTYMLAGRMVHRDSFGNRGTIGPGDVQWMTAGSGMIHSEMPAAGVEGGRLEGFQIWVNLPARDKMMQPRYQEIPADRIPAVESANGKVRVRVIAGEALGAKALIDTRVPISYLHFTLRPGAEHIQAVLPDQRAVAYVIQGRGEFGPGSKPAGERNLVLFGNTGDGIRFANPTNAACDLGLLVLSGTPLGEPVARHGPFVMNTQEELAQAFKDFRGGKMGRL
jgi:redox-sensitive bicupin YhaK (pirin superfamily)